MQTATQWYTDIEKQYALVSGREIYCAPSITGLNRLPVTFLAGYVLSGADSDDEELYTIFESLLVEGSLFWLGGTLIQNITEAGPKYICQTVPDEAYQFDNRTLTRRYTQTPDGDWLIEDIRAYGSTNQEIVGTGFAPGEVVTYWYNSQTPTGILYPAQYTFRRLEEIANTARVWQSGPGAKTIVSGAARNRDLVEQNLMSTSPVAFVVGDIEVERLTTTAAIDQLFTEMDRLQPLYYQQVHIVDTTSPVQRPSGADRSLVLGPMMRFIDTVRDWITDVLALRGQTWTYERIHTTDVLERTQELGLLQQLLALGAISAEVFTAKAGRLA